MGSSDVQVRRSPRAVPGRALLLTVRLLLAALSLFAMSCAALRPCAAREATRYAKIAKQTSYAEMKQDALNSWGADAPQSLVEWLDGEIHRLQAQQLPSDELWFRREEKGAGSGWYTDTYLLIRGCKVVATVETRDDM